MQVLKTLIQRSPPEHKIITPSDINSIDSLDIRHKLLCIITAFDLLSGQGMKDNYPFMILMPYRRGVEYRFARFHQQPLRANSSFLNVAMHRTKSFGAVRQHV